MFEVAELGNKLSKKDYNEQVPALRTELLTVQEALKSADFPVIVLVAGVDGAGKGETVNLLNEWLDPRYVRTFAFGEMTDEERERPEYWRFWRALPPKGSIAFMSQSGGHLSQLLETGFKRDIRFRYGVSFGNQIDFRYTINNQRYVKMVSIIIN